MSALTVDSFVQKVLSSGLLSAPQCAELNRSLDEYTPRELAAAFVVEKGLLTSFQVQQLASGNTKLILGQYQILDELGRGGFGCVYRARHRLMDRVVALKLIAPTLVENERARTNFLREVRATTRLNHPNIVTAYDANEIDDTLYFVMEFVDGMNLHQLVKKHGPLSIRLASELLIQVCLGLQYAHEQGMVHRDIKPANLLVPRQAVAKLAGQSAALEAGAAPVLAKVVDFGLARLCAPMNGVAHSQTERGFLGTPDFVSPEQARDSKAVDIRADLYSVGCTLYHALTGRAPFQGTSPMEIIAQHLEKVAPPVERLRPDIPPLLASIVRRLMAKDPDKRFQTPAELIGEMRFFLGTCGAGRVASEVRTPLPFQEQPPVVDEASMPVTNRISMPIPDLERNRPLPESSSEELAAPATMVTPGPIGPAANATCSPRLHGEDDASVRELPAHDVEIPTRDDVPIAETWELWLAVLDDPSMRLNPDDYRLIHGALLRALGNRAEASANPQRTDFQRILAIVQPWLTVEAIRQADRATIEDLRAQCQVLGRATGLTQKTRIPCWAFLALLLITTVLGLALMVALESSGPLWSFGTWWSYLKTNTIAAAAITLSSVGAASFMIFSRTRQTRFFN